MTYHHIATQLAADRQQRFEAEAAAFRTAAAARRLTAKPSHTTIQISLLRRRLKQPATPHAEAAVHPCFDCTAGEAS